MQSISIKMAVAATVRWPERFRCRYYESDCAMIIMII